MHQQFEFQEQRCDETRSDVPQGYWVSGEFVELTPDVSYIHRYVHAVDAESQKTLDHLYDGLSATGDESILKIMDNTYFVFKDYRLPEGNYYESPVYKSSMGDDMYILPRIVVSMKDGYEIDGILERLGSMVTVESSEPAFGGGTRYVLNCQMNTSKEVLAAVQVISGLVESEGISYFEPEIINLSIYAANMLTGIQALKTAKGDDAIYNLAGQRVDAFYKGVVIQNGKKRIVK